MEDYILFYMDHTTWLKKFREEDTSEAVEEFRGAAHFEFGCWEGPDRSVGRTGGGFQDRDFIPEKSEDWAILAWNELTEDEEEKILDEEEAWYIRNRMGRW